MAQLPWDDWFYHLSERRDEVNGLHARAVAQQAQVQADVSNFNHHLAQARTLAAQNQVLLLLHATILADDQSLAQYKTKIAALPTAPPGVVALKVLEGVSEGIAEGLALAVIWNATKAVVRRFLAKPNPALEDWSLDLEQVELDEFLFDTGLRAESLTVLSGGPSAADASVAAVEDVGEEVTEAAAKTVLGDMTAGSLALTGLGIFAAIGIDAIFGAINGATTRHQLDEALSGLQAALNKVDAFSTAITQKAAELRTSIVQQQAIFLGVVGELAKIQPATFTVPSKVGMADLPAFLAAQTSAISEYNLLVTLRETYQAAHRLKPDVTRDEVIKHLLFTAPIGVTEDILKAYWAVLATYSNAMAIASKAP